MRGEERGPKKKKRLKREAMQQPTDFLAGLFRPILHKIITLLHPPPVPFSVISLLASIFLPLDLLIF